MKILEINKFHYPKRGAERHYFDVIDLLQDHGHEVAVFAMQHPKNLQNKWEKYFVSYVGYNDDSNFWQKMKGVFRMFWSFEARRKITKLLDSFQPDIVHIHNIYHQISPSILSVIKKRGIPIVMTVHDHNLVSPDKDAYWEHVGKQYWKFLRIQKYSFLKRILLVVKMYVEHLYDPYENVDVFITPSRFLKNNLVQGGIPQEKIHVLPHFIKPSANPSVENTDDPSSYALYLGSISAEKGVDQLMTLCIEASIPLVLAGNKEGNIKIPESMYIQYVGHKNKDDLEELIQRSTCVVSYSHLSETFGLIALEANVHGKPFLGFTVGALGEIIKNGENGCLVDNQDEFQKTLKRIVNKEIHYDAVKIARKTRDTYNRDVYYEAFSDLIHSS